MDIFVHFLLYSMLNTMYNTINVYNLSNIYFILYCNMFYDHEAIIILQHLYFLLLLFWNPRDIYSGRFWLKVNVQNLNKQQDDQRRGATFAGPV